MRKIIVLILLLFVAGCTANNIKDNSKKEKTNIKENKDKKQEKNNYVSYNGKLKVDGKYLVNQYNEKIQLKGISSHGMQWYSNFVNKDSLKYLKESFNANVFRIAMYTKEGGYIDNKSVKDKIIKTVEIAKDLDMYVIIDWHILSDNNPNTYKDEAIKFFKEMAEKYKDYDNVIFEICNEPNGNTKWEDVKTYAEYIIPVIRKYSNNIRKSYNGNDLEEIYSIVSEYIDSKTKKKVK